MVSLRVQFRTVEVVIIGVLKNWNKKLNREMYACMGKFIVR